MHFLVKWITFSVKKQNIKKILEKWPKILEKSGKSPGILSVRNSGNPVIADVTIEYGVEEAGVYSRPPFPRRDLRKPDSASWVQSKKMQKKMEVRDLIQRKLVVAQQWRPCPSPPRPNFPCFDAVFVKFWF